MDQGVGCPVAVSFICSAIDGAAPVVPHGEEWLLQALAFESAAEALDAGVEFGLTRRE